MSRKNIISISRRTDIPAYYSLWLKNRLKEGCCSVVNPFNLKSISQISLKPEDVSFLVFWTRDPSPLYQDNELWQLLEKNYNSFFLVTFNGYPPQLEPKLYPQREKLMQAFSRLSELTDPERVIWRYDPIVISSVTPVEFHRKNFIETANLFEGKTRRVIVSVLDMYRSVRQRLKKAEEQAGVKFKTPGELSKDIEFMKLIKFIAAAAKERGMSVQSCCEEIDLSLWGIPKGGCIDADLCNSIIEKSGLHKEGLFGNELQYNLWGGCEEINIKPIVYKKDSGQRKNCLCTVSRDIGAYKTCLSECLYCYAGSGYGGRTVVKTEVIKTGENKKENDSIMGGEYHDPFSPSLTPCF